VFLSERDQYSIDVYEADAATGTIRRRLIRTAADPHFDSLEFIESAGAWDPSGQRFSLAAMHAGHPVLTILDMRTGTVDREIDLPDLDQVYSPSWSPDGRTVVFSAIKGGLTDLYLLDLQTKQVRALTSDAFADLQPAWSPDGKTIAFATDRFSSSLTKLDFGNIRLALFDVSTGEMRELPGLPGSKQIDPQWSRDGRSLFFIADADDHSNIYRLDLETRELFQMTDVATGVSGVTALSPALSVASASSRFAYTVYRHGGYQLRIAETGAGTRLHSALSDRAAADPCVRPTCGGGIVDETRGLVKRAAVAAALPSPDTGLLDARDPGDFKVKPYDHGLSLNGIGQPYLSAGGGTFGSFVRAGISFSFGDMLGDQSLETSIQAGSRLDDLAFQTAYVNRRSRWNWAIAGGQIPSVLGASQSSSQTTADGSRTFSTEDVLYRQIHRELSGVAIYPFSRAKRVELRGGFHSITFDRETTTGLYSATTGERLQETHRTTRQAAPVTLVETGAALVYDTALIGPTGPVLGTRYRFELAPTVGQLSLATVTADYRRYLMPARPFTLAFRVKHVGRYGPDAGDPRLLPLVWDLRDIVRGYDPRALTSRSCGQNASADCSVLQYLSARQVVMSNVELRFPILGALRHDASYGPLPLEGFVFSDNAWFRTHVPGTTWATPLLLRSVGAGVRLNARGFVFDVAAARRLDGFSPGWSVAVNFGPGF
jgi:hypothetical protein